MKLFRLAFVLTICLFTTVLTAKAQVNPSQTYVQGYTRSDGTYVQGYYKTNPNNTNRDNFTTKPNVNPYTSQPGYIEPDNRPASTNSLYSTPSQSNSSSSYSTPSYSTPSNSTPVIQTGPRGGQYYINSNGNKTYIRN